MRNDLEIERVPIARLRPYPGKLRIHNRKKLRKMVSLLRRYGQATPILIDEDDQIIDGHAVVDGLEKLGVDEVAVIVVRNRTPVEIRALRLALNRIAEETAWDMDNLRIEFRELLELGFDMELTGFDAVEIDMTLDIEPASTGTIEEAAEDDLEPAADLRRSNAAISGCSAII